jgi:glycerol transport system ATP-binding protein
MTYLLDNLTVKQGSDIHLDGVTLSLPSAGVVTVIGRTLAGKTTLLKVLAGLIAPQSGSLTKDGADLLAIPAWRSTSSSSTTRISRFGTTSSSRSSAAD